MSRAVLLLHVYTPTTPTDASAATTETASATAAAPQAARSQRTNQGDEATPVLLKELLTERYDPDYTVLIVQGWEDAIVRKVVQAVPVEDDTFEHEYRGLDGRKRKLKLQNEVVILTPAAEAWMNEQVEKARLEIMKNTGRINVTANDVRDLSSVNLQDLAQLAELRTQHVAEKRKRSK